MSKIDGRRMRKTLGQAAEQLLLVAKRGGDLTLMDLLTEIMGALMFVGTQLLELRETPVGVVQCFDEQDRRVSLEILSDGSCVAVSQLDDGEEERIPMLNTPAAIAGLRLRPTESRHLRWVVEIDVHERWVQDGFDLTEDKLNQILGEELSFASSGSEYGGRILHAPPKHMIEKLQGKEGANDDG